MIACGRIPVNGKDGYAEILFLPEADRPVPVAPPTGNPDAPGSQGRMN